MIFLLIFTILFLAFLIYERYKLKQETLILKENLKLKEFNLFELTKNIELIQKDKESDAKIYQNRILDLENIIKAHKETILQKDQTLNEQIKNLIANEFKNFSKDNNEIKTNLINDNIKQINEIAQSITTKLSETVSKHNVIIDQVIKENKIISNAFLGSNSAGQLGEALLQTKLESLGMKENENFFSQMHGVLDGNKFIPDFVILLPANQFIVIDSKVSISMIKDDDRTKVASAIRDSMKRFGQKSDSYLESTAIALEKKFNKKYIPTISFCLMYLPSEKLIEEIDKIDSTILSDAYKNNIIICGPTSLNAILQFAKYNMIMSQHQENYKKNANIIIKIANDIFKMNNIMSDLGNQINKSIESYKKIGKLWNKSLEKPLQDLKEYLALDVDIKKIDLKEEPQDAI